MNNKKKRLAKKAQSTKVTIGFGVDGKTGALISARAKSMGLSRSAYCGLLIKNWVEGTADSPLRMS